MPTLNPPSPAVIGQIALKLSQLSAEEVSGVLQILDHLSPVENSTKPRTAAEILAIAKRRAALLRDVPREQVEARFAELAEEIRQEAITNALPVRQIRPRCSSNYAGLPNTR